MFSTKIIGVFVYAHGRNWYVVIGFDMEVQPLVTHNERCWHRYRERPYAIRIQGRVHC